ncbi:MAG: SCO family protein [Propionibacteriales bacterium]|nr:SCO family protein [Propionibacteriales bacterium]
MNRLRLTATAMAGALLALLVLTGCGSSPRSVDLAGTVVDPPYGVSDVALTTDDGRPWSMSKDTTKALTLVFFGYTQCPDICPGVLSAIASALTRLTPEQQAQIELVFITTDPKRDTPAVLKDYLGRFNPSYLGLTSDLATVGKVAEPLHVFVDAGDQLPSGGYDPNSHGTQIFGINAKHEAPIFWGAETSPAQFADDFRFLIDEKPERLRGPNS